MRILQEKSLATATSIGAALLLAGTVLVGCGGSSSDGGTVNPPTIGSNTGPPLPPPPPAGPPPPDPVTPPSKPAPSPPPVTTPGSPPSPPKLPAFDISSKYANRCLMSAEIGEQYGHMVDEMHFLRSWSYETHLWHYDIKDVDQSKYVKPKPAKEGDHLENMREYYKTLKASFAPPNENKVPFHHMEFATENIERHNGQIDPYHGLSWRVVSNEVPRDIRVLRVEEGSPAAELEAGFPKVKRGYKLLKFRGIDVVNTTNRNHIYDINHRVHGIRKLNKEEKIDYEFLDDSNPQSPKPKEVTLTAKRNVQVPIPVKRIIGGAGDKVAYLALNSLQHDLAEKPLNEQFRKFDEAEVKDLILDLRHNHGGSIYLAAQLAYMIAGDKNTKGKMFAKIKLNYDAEADNQKRNKIPLVPIEFGKECQSYSTYDCDDKVIDDEYSRRYYSLDLDRVFILTSNETCGASEALINGLRGAGVEVILIGTGTCGLIYGSLPETNCGITYYAVQYQIRNGKDFGDYADGFKPANSPATNGVAVKGCFVVDNLNTKLGSDEDVLLDTALKFRKDGAGACPAPPKSLPAHTLKNGPLFEVNSSNVTVTNPPKKWYGYNMDITVPVKKP